jgi:hypothetical protein
MNSKSSVKAYVKKFLPNWNERSLNTSILELVTSRFEKLITFNYPYESIVMNSQKNVDYLRLSKGLFEINEKIMYVVVVDIFGKVVEQYGKDLNTCFREEEINNQLRNIAFATNGLTFENVKLMLLEKNNQKIAIINLNEDSIIIGIDRIATWSDISGIFSYVECMTTRTPFLFPE